MVKLHKKFFAGDKVFAKVRGYPPWPAKVSSVIYLTIIFYIFDEINNNEYLY